MPWSVFLGRVPVPGEPLWTDEDRGWSIALLEYEADLCSGCGQPRSESMGKANEFHYSPTVLRCHACKTVARKADDLADSKDTKGLMIGVKLEGGGHG